MLNPKGNIFVLREHLFKYFEGQLFIATDDEWNSYGKYANYDLAVKAAEEIVEEYYDMRAHL